MHTLVSKFIAGELPEPMANALVGGSLPMQSLDLLQALAHAVFRETPYGPKAMETLQGMPESLLSSSIIGPVDPPDPLGLICTFRREASLLEQAMLHENFSSAWMERVISYLPGKVLDIPLNNQVMWMERPAILDLLECHPDGDYNLKRKIQEFRFEVLRLIPAQVAKDRLEIINEVEAGRLDKIWAELPLPEADADEEESVSEALARERAERLAKLIKEEAGEDVNLTLTQRVMKLRTNQKILLATKGGKEERTLLIRESNRLVQVAVIRNGRITEGEVAYIAQMRAVHDEVLRIISLNREWMKKYTIVKNLVQNPRTPLPIALTHLKRINEFDLKLMSKDRNVAEALRREAKRFQENRGNR